MGNRVAIITARGGSKRIPRKNIREFCGKPIIAYGIQAALDSGLFSEVMVSTDDEKIAEVAKKLGAQVPFSRSAKNSDDFATTLDVIKEVLQEYSKRGVAFEEYCCIYPTAPFLTGTILKNAYNEMKAKHANGVVPICRFSYPIQRALKLDGGRPRYVQPEFAQSRSQDLEPRFHDAGQFYMGTVDHVLKARNLFDDGMIGFEVDELHVQDIDSETDWLLAELKYKILNRA